ncbi:DEK-like protein [Mya arenaria]|uniref:DEK-like protein n=1 Tax=Mya arenaria TaxID=6604 RepID=A0ABY7FWE1_MYAAR|nr:DEK-like protein [Mya arenaria]
MSDINKSLSEEVEDKKEETSMEIEDKTEKKEVATEEENDSSEDKNVTKTKDDEEEEDDEEDDEPQVGLLEQPLVLEEGKKRERKKVERLDKEIMQQQQAAAAESVMEIKEGKGRALGDIPFIEFMIGRKKCEDLKPLHRLLFKKPGKLQLVKKHLRQFSGFPFSTSDQEYEKRLQLIKTYTISMLKVVAEVLDLQRGGTKGDLVDRIMEWLQKPEDSGRKIPQPKKKRKSKGGDSEKKSRGKKKSVKKEKKEKMLEDDEESEEEGKGDDSEEEDAKGDDSEEEKEEAKGDDSEEDEANSESDDDAPLVGKAKSPPSNDELKDLIKKMLENANLEQVTMKTILKDVFAKYPSFDLTDRKDFIKNTVKQM